MTPGSRIIYDYHHRHSHAPQDIQGNISFHIIKDFLVRIPTIFPDQLQTAQYIAQDYGGQS